MNSPLSKPVSPQIHWARGGSTSDRIKECPGCVHIAAQYPKDPGGPAAIDGTHTHTLLSTCLDHNLVDAGLCVGTDLTDHEGTFRVEQDRADRVNKVLRYIAERKQLLGQGTEVLSEVFVDAGTQVGIPEWGGALDVGLINDHYWEVIDLKDGRKPVSAETYQMVTYGGGLIAMYPERLRGKPGRTTIVQPKVAGVYDFVDYSPMEFDVKFKILENAMRLSLDPNAPRNPGAHCTWCPGAKPGRCPEYNERGNKAVSELFAGVPAPLPPDPNLGGLPAPAALPLQIPTIDANMSNEQLAQILDAKEIILGLLSEAEAEALKRAVSGKRIPGRKVVRSTTHRRWTKDALEALRKIRFKVRVYEKTTLVSPKQVVESEEYKALSDSQRKKVDALIEKPEGTLKLVPESDPAKAISFDTKDMFADVPKPPSIGEDKPEAPAAPPPPPSFF